MAAKVDLVAIFPGGDPVLIQAKPRAGSIPKKQRGELATLAAEIKGCAYEAYREKGVRYDAIHCFHDRTRGKGSACPIFKE